MNSSTNERTKNTWSNDKKDSKKWWLLTHLTVTTTPPTHIVQNLIIAELPTSITPSGNYSSSMTSSLAHANRLILSGSWPSRSCSWGVSTSPRGPVREPMGYNPSKNPKRQLDDQSDHPKVIFAVQVDIYFYVNISFYNFKWPKHVESFYKTAVHLCIDL